MEEYLKKYEEWKKSAADLSVVKSLQEMSADEIKEAFYKDLSFGTGGLRGIMTAGTSRLNVYTIKKTTEGLAKYLLTHGKSSCAVCYDSRLNSETFARLVAATLASFNITVYITKECMPTPFLSFAVRYYKCGAGVNVTASHNPSDYNGYKVYDENGCQLTDNVALELTEYIERAQLFGVMPKFEDYIDRQIRYIDDACERSYKTAVMGESLGNAYGLKVTYTPLNGAGYRIVPEVLKAVGVDSVTVVSEQSYPDGHFTTCPYPNPEKAEALVLATVLAEKERSDVVIATDPDCDRLGVAVLHDGRMVQLSGNEVGVLLCDYILSQREANKTLPQNPVIVKTIVTTTMIDALASKYGAEVRNVLTGFKYIGDVINKLEKAGKQKDYVFGFEESCGYLKGIYARDKDGVVASMLFAECAALCKRQGKTVIDRLNELSDELGYYYGKTVSYRFEGVEGERRKNYLLAGLRNNPITHLGDSAVVDSCDFLIQTKYDLPRSNVLRYNSANGSQLIIRPSGTEPLIKCYAIVKNNKKLLDEIFAQTDVLFG